MVSWARTISSPFKKARSFFNTQQQGQGQSLSQRDNEKSPESGLGHIEHQQQSVDLQCEVMACGYEDVQVMWSILDKSKSRNRNNLSH